MARRPAVLAGIVVFSLLLGVIPSGAAAGSALSAAGSAPAETQRLDLVALGPSGAMLLAASGTDEVRFFEVQSDLTAAAAPLSVFDIRTQVSSEALAAPRLAALSPGQAAIASLVDGRAVLTAVDPFLGELQWQISVSGAGERAEQVSVVAMGNGFLVSSFGTAAGASSVVLVQFTASGGEVGRISIDASGASGAALVPASPTPLLSIHRATEIELLALGAGPSAQSLGSISVTARSAALWLQQGSLGALIATPSGLVRAQALLPYVAGAHLTTVPGVSGATGVAAVASVEGRLAAIVGQSSGAVLVRETAIGQYSLETSADIVRAAASSDSFGLARLVALRGTPSAFHLVTATAGDTDALSVALGGPSQLIPTEPVSLTASVGAVRSPMTVAGVDVDVPAGWSYDVSPSSFAIAAGTSVEATVRILAPAGTAPGSYEVSVTPAAAETSVHFVAARTLQVVDASQVAASVSGVVDLAPGETTQVQIAVVNRGPAATTVDVAAQAPGGFLLTPLSQQVTVPSGGTSLVSFSVSVAQGTPPVSGELVSITLRTPDGAQPVAVELPALIRAEFLPSLVIERGDISAAPASTMDVPISVVNWGNVGQSVLVRASVAGLPESALAFPHGLVWIPPFAKASMALALSVPPAALAGTPFEVTVGLEDPATGLPLAPAVSVGGSVIPSAGIAASYRAGPAVKPGEEATGALVLENLGNAQAVVDLTLGPLPAGFALRAVDAQIGGLVLRPFATLEVPLVYRAPPSALPGTTALPIVVASTAGARVALEARVEVLETKGLLLAPVTGPVTVLDPGRISVAVEFEVTNVGNTPAALSFGWSRAPTSLFVLDAAGRATPISLLEPTVVGPRTSTVFRAVVPLAPSSAVESDPIAVTVDSSAGLSLSTAFDVFRPRADPQVLGVRVELGGSGGKVGSLHQVVANVINNGPATAADVRAVLSIDGVAVGIPLPVTGLAAGRTRTLTFDFVPRSAVTELTVTLLSADAATDRDVSNNALSISYDAVVEPASPTVPPQAVPAAAVSLSVIALLALALTEIGKTSLISTLFLPLFVKFNPSEVLDQYLRGQIHGYIIANPGEHYNAIKDQLGVTNGALAYHLRVLEKAELIRAQRDGMYKRFYPVGVKIPKRRRLSSFQEAIVKTVRDNPAVSQKQIAELLGVSNQVVNYHVKQLEDSGVLKVDRSERASKLFLGPEAPPAEPVAPAPPGAPVADV